MLVSGQIRAPSDRVARFGLLRRKTNNQRTAEAKPTLDASRSGPRSSAIASFGAKRVSVDQIPVWNTYLLLERRGPGLLVFRFSHAQG
jgi:hypothetical protein